MPKKPNYEKSLTPDMINQPAPTQWETDRLVGTITRVTSEQLAAANLTFSKIMRHSGVIVDVRIMLGGAVAASGESMTLDALIAGVSALTAVKTVDATTAVDKWNHATLGAARRFTAGSLVTLVRAYTAGGGPTPMTNTLVEMDVLYDE